MGEGVAARKAVALTLTSMFKQFTLPARRVVVLAQEEARMLNHNYIGTEHILLGLIHEGEGVAAKALESLNISLEAVRQQVEEIIGQGQAAPTGHIPFTPRAKKVLELSLREALQLGHNYIGTEHILLGLIREGEGVAAQVLQLGANLNRVRQTVIQLLSGYVAGSASGRFGEAEMTELTSEMTSASEPSGESELGGVTELSSERAPMCPSCLAKLDDTLAIRVVETTETAEEDEPVALKIAYCARCGVAFGTVA
jgi:ATP-dependent Clp protease ATP-binding subunit ClpA